MKQTCNWGENSVNEFNTNLDIDEAKVNKMGGKFKDITIM